MKKSINFAIAAVVTFVGTLALLTFAEDSFDADLAEILGEINAEIDHLETTEETYTADENELETAISTLYGYGVTKFDTPTTFMHDKSIRRDEAGTMYVRLMNTLQLPALEHSNNCSFADIKSAHSDLYDVVEESCNKGLFKGSKGNFLPKRSITNAQAITVLVRMLDGFKYEDGDHFAEEYIQWANNKNLLLGLDLLSKTEWDREATRGTVAILLARADDYVKDGIVLDDEEHKEEIE